MRKHNCTILTTLSVILFLFAGLLLLTAIHGLWTGWLFSPGALDAEQLPHSSEREPGLYWLSALSRIGIALLFAGLGTIVFRVRHRRCG